MKRTRWYLAMESYWTDYKYSLWLIGLEATAIINADCLYKGCVAFKVEATDDEAKRLESYLLNHGLWVDDLEAYLKRLEDSHRRYQLIKAMLNV